MSSVRRPNAFIRYGLPMLAMLVAGSVGLSHLMQGRLVPTHALHGTAWQALLSRQDSISRPLFPSSEHESCALLLVALLTVALQYGCLFVLMLQARPGARER